MEERVRRSLAAIETELEQNREVLGEAFQYHRMVSDSLRALSGRGQTEIPAGFPPDGFIHSPELSSTAWRTAQVAGTIAEMEHEILLLLSGVYTAQAQYVENRGDLLMNTYLALLQQSMRSEPGTPINPFRQRPGPIGGMLSDQAGWEERLLDDYDEALDRLSGR